MYWQYMLWQLLLLSLVGSRPCCTQHVVKKPGANLPQRCRREDTFSSGSQRRARTGQGDGARVLCTRTIWNGSILCEQQANLSCFSYANSLVLDMYVLRTGVSQKRRFQNFDSKKGRAVRSAIGVSS